MMGGCNLWSSLSDRFKDVDQLIVSMTVFMHSINGKTSERGYSKEIVHSVSARVSI